MTTNWNHLLVNHWPDNPLDMRGDNLKTIVSIKLIKNNKEAIKRDSITKRSQFADLMSLV